MHSPKIPSSIFLLASLLAAPSFATRPLAPCLPGEVSGRVFREFNVNGNADPAANLTFGNSALRTDFPGTVGSLVDEFTGGAPYADVGKHSMPLRHGEWGLSGVTVTVSSAAGMLGTATTDSSGAWSFDGSTLAPNAPLIVEFSGWAPYFQPGPLGENNRGSVVRTENGSCGIDFTLAKPSDHCSNDPGLALSCFVGEESVSGGGSGNAPTDVVVTLGYDSGTPFVVTEDDPACCDPEHTSGSYTANEEYMNAMPGDKAEVASWQDIGTVYGIAVDRRRSRVLSAAFFRPYTLPGSDGYGAIYSDNQLWLDLAASPLGFQVERLDGEGELPINNVGFSGLGDLEIDSDNTRLFTTNLATQEVVIVPIADDGSPDTQNVMTTPAPVPFECAENPSGFSRTRAPFATAWHEGRLYVGVTCTDTASDSNGPHAFVFSTDLSSPILWREDGRADLNYFRYNYSFNYVIDPDTGEVTFFDVEGYKLTSFDDWGAEDRTYPEFPRCGTIPSWEGNFNQPWLVDIEFDPRPGRDDMILGVRNRLMDIWHSSACVNGGAVIRFCESGPDSESWTQEVRGNGACADLVPSTRPRPPYEFDAPWFYHDHMAEGRGSTGGLAQIPGFTELAMMAQGNIHRHMHAGVSWLSNTDGSRSRDVMMLGTLTQAGGGEFYKANNWGDVEAVCAPARIELGNLIWSDQNSNGIQDAGEPGIGGVTVLLYPDIGDDGIFGPSEEAATPESVLTDPQGVYSFNDNDHGLDWNSSYFVVIEDSLSTTLVGRVPVPTGVGSPSRDSNGQLVGPRVLALASTAGPGHNDHSIDFGFSLPHGPIADLSLEKSDAFDPVVVGTSISYTLSVTNHGPDDAANVLIHDTLPAGTQFSQGAGCGNVGQAVTCSVAIVPVGQTIDVELLVTLVSATPGSLINNATVEHDGHDLEPGNNNASETTTIEAEPTHPQVLETTSGPTAEPIGECDNLLHAPSVLGITFDEPMNNPADHHLSTDLTNPLNYLLVAPGPNGQFDTQACKGPEGDDILFPITSVTAGPGDQSAQLHLPVALENNLYHLHACGTLADTAGDNLDGDGDGTGGDDFIRLFRMDTNNAAINGQLDCDLGSWSRATTTPEALYFFDPSRDVEGLADSGSMYIDARAGSPVFNISQCLRLPNDANIVELSTRYLLPSGAPNLQMELSCRTYTQSNCSGDIIDDPSVPFFPLSETTGGNWGFFGNQMIVTPAAASTSCATIVFNPDQAPIELWLDDITVLVDFFRFDFEGGNTWAFTHETD